MNLAFTLSPTTSLFGMAKTVSVRTKVGPFTMSGMLVSKAQLDHARANIDPYLDLVRDAGYGESLIQRHLATILNPPRAYVGSSRNETGDPSGGFLIIGSDSSIRGVTPRFLKRGEAIVPEDELAAVASYVEGVCSTLGITPLATGRPALFNELFFEYLEASTLAYRAKEHYDDRDPLSTPGGWYTNYWDDVPTYLGKTYFLGLPKLEYVPGFLSVHKPGYGGDTVDGWAYAGNIFTGIPYFIMLDHFPGKTGNSGVYGMQSPTPTKAGHRAAYSAVVSGAASAILEAHRVWNINDVEKMPELAEGTSPDVLAAAINTESNRMLDWTLGEELYYIGAGGNMKFFRTFGSAMTISESGGNVMIDITGSEMVLTESDERLSSRLATREGMEAASVSLLASNEGTRARLHPPYSLGGLRLHDTIMWELLDDAHDAFPDYVPSPESTVYATLGSRKITLGELNVSVPALLDRYPFMKTLSFVSHRAHMSAIKQDTWESVIAIADSRRIHIRKASYALHDTGGTMIKPLAAGEVPYLANNGIALVFPDESHADPEIKWSRADFETHLEIPEGQSVEEFWVEFPARPEKDQESRTQMPLAEWLTRDAGVPNPAKMMANDVDEGLRYVHALNARKRTNQLLRVLCAMGLPHLEVDEEFDSGGVI